MCLEEVSAVSDGNRLRSTVHAQFPEDVVNVLVKAGVSPQLSLLSEMHIVQMYLTIDGVLTEKVPDIPILPCLPVVNGISCSSCLAKCRCSYGGFIEIMWEKM